MFDQESIEKPKIYETAPSAESQIQKLSKDTHTKVMDYLRYRVNMGKQDRDLRLRRMVIIDRAVAGWMRLDEKERRQALDEYRTGKAEARNLNLPLVWLHLDDLITYYMETFSPGRGMFYQSGKPDEVDSAQQIVTLMNNHAIYSGYYPELQSCFWAINKYNLGGLRTEWAKESGPSFDTEDSRGSFADKTIWAGNKVCNLDMYNTFLDSNVKPEHLFSKGEWGAYAEKVSYYELSVMAARGEINGVEEAVKQAAGGANTYYVNQPDHMQLTDHGGEQGVDDSSFNWAEYCSIGTKWTNTTSHEMLTVYIRLQPEVLGLGTETKHSLWMFKILNGETIVCAKPVNNVHNHIPMYFAKANDDGLGHDQKSIGELLKPLQSFGSFLMNYHIKSARKSLGGLTVYDKTIVDLSQMAEGEQAARIETASTKGLRPISDGIWTDNTSADNTGTMQNLSDTMGLMDSFFPTQSQPSQVADIDRAVSNQVTAVQQGQNRRAKKTATLMDVQMMTPMRFGLYYNILQFQEDGESVTDYRGRVISINLSELKKTDLPMIIGMGLKAIERMMIADKIQNVIFALIQNPNAAAKVDVLKMIDYWTDMLDIDFDFTSFAIEVPVGPDGQPIPGVAPTADGTGVQPATNPAAVTSPIYG